MIPEMSDSSKKLDAVMFDSDGVLLDTEMFYYLGWDGVLRELSGQGLSKKLYKEEYCGNSPVLISNHLVNHFKLDAKPEQVLQRQMELVQKLFGEREIRKMPHAEEALIYVANRKPVAIVTGATQEQNLLKFERSGIIKVIEKYKIPTVSLDMVEREKSKLDIYLLAADMLHADPSKCMSFEDSLPGIESAKAAGTDCFPVPNKWTYIKMPQEMKVYKNLPEALTAVREIYTL
jgi:beta-phosphoglucomutase